MKTIMKLSLINGLLVSGIVFADSHSDAYQKHASPSHHHGAGSHHDAGSRSGGQGMEGKRAFWDKMAERLQLTTETTRINWSGYGKIKTANSSYKGKNTNKSKGITGTGKKHPD